MVKVAARQRPEEQQTKTCRVLKFGGSSVASAERMLAVGDIVAPRVQAGETLVVITSAMGGVTDTLLDLAALAASQQPYQRALADLRKRHQDALSILAPNDALASEALEATLAELTKVLEGVALLGEASLKTKDHILSFGERCASLLLATAFKSKGVEALPTDARDLIRTDESYSHAHVDIVESYRRMTSWFKNLEPSKELCPTPVVTGFIASSEQGHTTTLGRGGSDYTAALFGAALNVECIEIWTDVNGVLTANPRRVPAALSIDSMSYSEAMEMSHFGAKVIYAPTIHPALKANIPLLIKNTFEPAHSGTIIHESNERDERPVAGISSLSGLSLLTLSGTGMVGIPGIAGRLFSALAGAKVNVILISQSSSEHSICFVVLPQDVAKAETALADAFELEFERGTINPLSIEAEVSIIAVVGEGMRFRPGISGRLFAALGSNGVNVMAIAQGSSERNVSIVVPEADETKSLKVLHEAFFLSDHKVLNLYVVGVGLIGSALLEQIRLNQERLKTEHALDVRVVAVANSKKIWLDEAGIDLNDWQGLLSQSDTAMSGPTLLEHMRRLNLQNAVFVDNTASTSVAELYEPILNMSIPISTPNKEAASGDWHDYTRLRFIAQRRGIRFGHETTVGAGLPILSTLEDLRASGDTLLKIEGVLSGSLSFIFNSLHSNTDFDSVVRDAQSQGFTEPDPRIDLGGLDVCRKLVILARDAGWPLERSDIDVEAFLPDAVMQASDLNAFWKELHHVNGAMAAGLEAAEAAQKRLRVIGEVGPGGGKISLKAVSADHPFYGLSGSDNMVVFYSERYKERPLVVRGPGAGPQVTAAGVFAEILRIGRRDE